jgi:asparagine synthase (glutamine-hydrolysing)
MEVQYATRFARAIGVSHHVYFSGVSDGLDLLSRIAWYLEDPIPNIASFHSYLIGEVCRDEALKVVLLGEGSDELFAGYPWHHLALNHDERRPIATLFDLYQKRRSQRVAIDPYLTPAGRDLLSQRVERQRRIFEAFIEASLTDPLEAFLAFERGGQLQISQLQRVDRMFMAHGVEARVPYLYDNVVAVAASLPASAKVCNSWVRRFFGLRQDKVALARAFKGIVPQTILHRPKFGPKGTANLADHLEEVLAKAFRSVLLGNEYKQARDASSDLIDWRGSDLLRAPFKVKLLLSLVILCTHQFHLGIAPATASGANVPISRSRLPTHLPAR